MLSKSTEERLKAATRLLPPDLRQRLKDRVFAARALRTSDLDALALYFGTDKNSYAHGYARLYQRFFGPRRHAVKSVLEIGVGGTTSLEGYETRAGGQSLQMWSRYFPNASILGIDIHEKDVGGERVRFERGSQSDKDFLASLVRRYGPFDIVIDDGSHVGSDIIASFEALWDAITPGGFYAIEDILFSYHRDWGGGPPGTPGTAAALIKHLVDSTLRRAGEEFSPPIASMHVYGEIVFLERAG